MKNIGDRMKESYERPAKRFLTRRVPVIVRVDGRAFHTLTRRMKKPFDGIFMASMTNAAMVVSREISGCQAAYVQSDEASFLLTDYATHDTQPWFGYVQNKVESVTASLMSVHFNLIIQSYGYSSSVGGVFDARAFNVPREDVSNYFLWRMKDWERNSLSMYCQSVFSHKQLSGKGRNEQHEMLHSRGKNWTKDLGSREKNGTWIFPRQRPEARCDILPNYEEVSSAILHRIYVEGAPLLDRSKQDDTHTRDNTSGS